MTSSPPFSNTSKLSKSSRESKKDLSAKTVIPVTQKTLLTIINKPLDAVNAIEVVADLGGCDDEAGSCDPSCDCAKSFNGEEPQSKLCQKYKEDLEKEVKSLTDRFNLLLHNEQVRASYMLREAHRERQEKIQALQTQLECKNLSALMYVVCMERRKSKLEKLRLVEEYTSFIMALQQLLAEGQALILYLSRGYKTAARVDDEWREKMTSIIKQFQAFIYHYAGGSPETNQYFFDLPKLMKTDASLKIDPDEDPCDPDEEKSVKKQEVKKPEPPPAASPLPLAPEEQNAVKDMWFHHLTGEDRPFVVYGDLSAFLPDDRREICKKIKAEKTAPHNWKSYAFNEMFLKSSDCPNLDTIKDDYPERLSDNNWAACRAPSDSSDTELPADSRQFSRRMTSLDNKTMGSILKIMSQTRNAVASNRTMILAATDSMELQSSTKLLERNRHKSHHKVDETNKSKSKTFSLDLDIKRRRKFEEIETEELDYEVGQEDEATVFSSLVNDSMMCTKPRTTDADKINFEKICPAEQCKLMRLDEFLDTLPPYMRANPYIHFEQTFEQYQPCSPEQLEILKQRIDEKNARDCNAEQTKQDISETMAEWNIKETGIATQTSFVLGSNTPPCTCEGSDETGSTGSTDHVRVYNVKDLLPIKKAFDQIKAECLFDHDIDFNRFKIIGQESKESMDKQLPMDPKDFSSKRLAVIKKTLEQHPSLLDIFQANAQC